MNQKAPAGWYDDPAGSGGQRFWNGQSWTERVEGGTTASHEPRSGAQDRLPEGYMRLNGEQVPIGHSLPAQPRRGLNAGLLVSVAAIAAVIVLALIESDFDPSSFDTPGQGTTVETSEDVPWEDSEWEDDQGDVFP